MDESRAVAEGQTNFEPQTLSTNQAQHEPQAHYKSLADCTRLVQLKVHTSSYYHSRDSTETWLRTYSHSERPTTMNNAEPQAEIKTQPNKMSHSHFSAELASEAKLKSPSQREAMLAMKARTDSESKGTTQAQAQPLTNTDSQTEGPTQTQEEPNWAQPSTTARYNFRG